MKFPNKQKIKTENCVAIGILKIEFAYKSFSGFYLWSGHTVYLRLLSFYVKMYYQKSCTDSKTGSQTDFLGKTFNCYEFIFYCCSLQKKTNKIINA